MAATKKAPQKNKAANGARNVDAIVKQLAANATKKTLDEYAPRYGIVVKKALGTPYGKIKVVAKTLGKDHDLALQLWDTGWYEARLLASMVDEPEKVTLAQMERWAKAFDNWAVVDTVCFNLFDRVPVAFKVVPKWAKSRDEYVKRAAFALVACAGLHGHGTDADYQRFLTLIERCAEDERNFVKKGVSWALRAIGGKKSKTLRAEARSVAQRLVSSDNDAARWVGRDALKHFK